MRDYYTRNGAEIIAEAIRSYWNKRGRPASVTVVPSSWGRDGKVMTYGIVSNIINGWPPAPPAPNQGD
jgi:hypothetical protein